MTTTDEMQLSELFQLLSNSRRRYVLRYLGNNSVATTIKDLATQIAIWEGSGADATADRIESVRNSLVHGHLPKLADHGVLTYDATTGRVELIEELSFKSLLDAPESVDTLE